MKHLFTPLLSFVLLAAPVCRAEIVTIQVVDFQFIPANANVAVGDILRFSFEEGFHNATSQGAAIPAGAPEINSGAVSEVVRTYDYTVSVSGTYNYYCVAHGSPDGGGMAATFTASGPLPVSLASFLITASQDEKPVLTWKTLTEQNTAYFSIRSSTNGMTFTEIGRVTAKGNTTSEQEYRYVDNNVSNEHRYVYYEIVTVDKNGNQSFSPIKMFRSTLALSRLIMQLAPNPIKRPGQLMIQFNAEQPGRMQVQVYDMSGKRVLLTQMAAVTGLNNGHLHVCDLSPGIYQLQFSYEGSLETRRLVVQ